MSDTPTSSGGSGPKQPTLWQSRQIAVAILAGSIFIAASIAAVGLDDDDDVSIDDLLPSTTVTTVATGDGDTTTTTEADTRPSTSTTVVPGPTSTTVAERSTTTQGSTGTTQPAETCGNGSVRGEPRTGDITQDDSGWRTPVRALVISDFDRPIEVTSLVLRVVFEDGSDRLVDIDTAGVVIPADDAHTYDGPTITSNTRPTQVQIAELAYQPQGRPECNTAA